MSKPANKNTNTSFKFTAFTLVVALLFSFSADALHFLGHGDHDHCSDHTTTHFHKDEFDCKIFDFKFSSTVDFKSFENQSPIYNNYNLTENSYQVFYYQIYLSKNFNRGPPSV